MAFPAARETSQMSQSSGPMLWAFCNLSTLICEFFMLKKRHKGLNQTDRHKQITTKQNKKR